MLYCLLLKALAQALVDVHPRRLMSGIGSLLWRLGFQKTVDPLTWSIFIAYLFLGVGQ
jgi:hypothetical protein